MDILLEGFWWGFGIMSGMLWAIVCFSLIFMLIKPKPKKPKPPVAGG